MTTILLINRLPLVRFSVGMSLSCDFVFVFFSSFVCSLRITLFSDAAEVRAATLRAIRYFVQNQQSLRTLLDLNIHHLIARSLDIVLDNQIERIQALRLLRNMLAIDPSMFPLALGRCLCAIANDNSLEKDMLLRACWATIAELTIVNVILAARAGCVAVVIKCALASAVGSTTDASGNDLCRDRNQQTANGVTGGTLTTLTVPYTNIAISEAILTSFLHLYNWPETRKLLQPNGSDLFHFIAPFTDAFSFLHASNAALKHSNYIDQFDYRDEPKPFDNQNTKVLLSEQPKPNKTQQLQQQQYANYEHRTLRYLACKNAILSILRSFPGMLYMCRYIESRKSPSSSPVLFDYSDAYKVLGFDVNRSLIDSLKFFGLESELIPKKVNQMFAGVEKALDIDCQRISSFFTTNTSLKSLNPLESLISIFHLPYPEVHRHLLDLFFELFGLKTPKWTESFDQTLKCFYFTLISRKTYSNKDSNQKKSGRCIPEEWQLYDGFVVKEAEQILSSRSTNRLNFIVNYYALLLQSLVEFGLLEGIVSVVLDSNDKAAVNLATILIGELLHLSGKYLPASIYAHRCQSLPSLVAASMSDCKKRRNRALNAITNLDRIHRLKKRPLQPASLFLEQQIYFCKKPTTHKSRARSGSFSKVQDENVIGWIRNTGVFKSNNTFKQWNWSLIGDLLKHPPDVMLRLEEKDVRQFVRHLLDFYSPSKRQFSLISKNSANGASDLASQSSGSRNEMLYFDNPHFLCVVAIDFIDYLLHADEQRASEFLTEFIRDLDQCLKNIASKCPSSEEIFIPSRLLSTLSHHYFLLLGRFTSTTIGRRYIESTHIYQYLLDLISLSTNEVYMKLIVSSLDYTEASFPRTLLAKVLTSTPEQSRLYATQYFRVLLRARAPKFTDWAIDSLVHQLYDPSTAVSLAALDVLDEACSGVVENLQKLILCRPAILQLGDNGIIFFTRFASLPSGLNFLYDSNMLENELERWKTQFCFRYVRIVEDALNECFSCHQKSGSGKYGRRSDKRHFPYPKHISMTTFLPPHLYGQLVQTSNGLQIVRQKRLLDDLCQEVSTLFDSYISDYSDLSSNNPNEANTLRMKASLWAIGHIATSEEGIRYLLEWNGEEGGKQILTWITTLVKRSLVLSVRATCFYLLCLISSTRKGAEVLSEYGWNAIRHSHNEIFPVNQQEYDNFYYDCRPRFMSDDSDKSIQSKAIVSIPSASFFVTAEDPIRSPLSHQVSQSSSRSSSSSYLSMAPTPGSQTLSTPDQTRAKEKENGRNISFTISSSSSSYSNTSLLGSLVATNSVNSNNRPRSSSDCLNNTASQSNRLAESKMNSKPECQDSGIMELDSKGIKMDFNQSRNRKISAPCFTNANRENRSDSNDSSRTNTTGNTNSRSTSFAEYSTSYSSNQMLDLPKMERNVSFLISEQLDEDTDTGSVASRYSDTSHKSGSKKIYKRLTLGNDDPYPSPVDAHGYAQLRAIQKRRVQSLSANMFFSGISAPSGLVDQYQMELESKSSPKSSKTINHSASSVSVIKNDPGTPEIFSTDSLQAKSRNLSSGSNLHLMDDNRSLQLGHYYDDLKPETLTNRTVSRVSKNSVYSSDSDAVTAFDENVDPVDHFMCLCLPINLSLIFELDEVSFW